MIQVDILKAKDISHNKRRNKRTDMLKQLDIEATIPTMVEQAEIQRQAIRDQFAALQTEIDNAETIDQLKGIITQL